MNSKDLSALRHWHASVMSRRGGEFYPLWTVKEKLFTFSLLEFQQFVLDWLR